MDAVDRKLLRRLQADFPLVPRPFAAIADEMGLGEGEVLERVAALLREGLVRRLGPVIDPAKVGRVATLAAMAVPDERIEAVASIVSAHAEVSHNYLRQPDSGECPYNLWFTVSAGSPDGLAEAVAAIEKETGLPAVALPVRRKFKIGVRFSFENESESEGESEGEGGDG